MRLYLSSWRLGRHADQLLDLVGRPAPRVLVTMNALDHVPAPRRRELYARAVDDFAELGIEARELDLRSYFSRPDDILLELSKCDLAWANGGNAFTLLMAMRQSGFIRALEALLGEDAIVYGGYSAGAVVAGPTLRGIELVDSIDPAVMVPEGYTSEIPWQGMGLVGYSIAPHFRSDHHESAAIERVVAYFEERGMPYRALRDGEVMVVDGDSEVHVRVNG